MYCDLKWRVRVQLDYPRVNACAAVRQVAFCLLTELRVIRAGEESRMTHRADNVAHGAAAEAAVSASERVVSALTEFGSRSASARAFSVVAAARSSLRGVAALQHMAASRESNEAEVVSLIVQERAPPPKPSLETGARDMWSHGRLTKNEWGLHPT